MPATLGQYEIRQQIGLVFLPPFPQQGGGYTATNRQGDPNFAPFDYLACSNDTIGFSRATAVLRFFPQFYEASPANLPLKQMVANELRRWEVIITRDEKTEPLQVNAVIIDNSGLVLELGSPIDALTYPSHPLSQFI